MAKKAELKTIQQKERGKRRDASLSLAQQIEQRTAELDLINAVQKALASRRDLQSIYDLVGNKIRDIFDAQVVMIGVYDPLPQLIHHPYVLERGKRYKISPMTPVGFRKHVIKTRKPILIDQNFEAASKKYKHPLKIMGNAPKSALFIPMVVGKEVKGIISLQNLDRENAFSESDVRLLTTLASSMGGALENARLLKEAEQRSAELALVNEIQTGLASKLDAKSVYEFAAKKIYEAFTDANEIWVYTIHADIKEFYIHYVITGGQPNPGLIGAVDHYRGRPYEHSHDQTAQMRDVLAVNENFRAFAEASGWISVGEKDLSSPEQSIMIVPLAFGERIFGHINVKNTERANAFGEAEIRLVRTIANGISVALENARLFDESQKRAAELAAINDIQATLSAKMVFKEMINFVGDKISEIFKTQEMSIRLVDTASNIVSFPYITDHGKKLEIEPMPLGVGFTWEIIRTRKPLVINDHMAEYSAQFGSYTIGEEVEPTLAFLGVPIINGDEVIGVITIESKQENAFTESDVSLLMTLSNSISVALDNARLLEETRRRAKETLVLNEVGREISSTLDLATVMDLIAQYAKDLLNVDTSGIFLPDSN